MTDPRVKAFEEIMKVWKSRKMDGSRLSTYTKISTILYLYEPTSLEIRDEEKNKNLST